MALPSELMGRDRPLWNPALPFLKSTLKLDELLSDLLSPLHCLQKMLAPLAKPTIALGPRGCGWGSWACMVSVFPLGLLLQVTDVLNLSLGQDSSALLPFSKCWSLGGPFWGDRTGCPLTSQVFPQTSKLLWKHGPHRALLKHSPSVQTTRAFIRPLFRFLT